MTQQQFTKKICLVGDFSVGKTSLVARYVNHTFSDKYLTTVGVSIKTRVVEVNDEVSVKLVIWDIAGEENLTVATERYLKGANGLIMVADGLRNPTIEASKKLLDNAQKLLGDVPHISIINKADLPGFSDKYPYGVDELENQIIDGDVFTSAKSGLNVEFAFAELAAMVVE